MKRYFLITLFAVFCLSGMAQNKFNLSGITSIVNYGVDYSLAKVYGGKETGHQYWVTYADLNEMFISKPKMFDIGKRLGIPVEVVSLQAVIQSAIAAISTRITADNEKVLKVFFVFISFSP